MGGVSGVTASLVVRPDAVAWGVAEESCVVTVRSVAALVCGPPASVWGVSWPPPQAASASVMARMQGCAFVDVHESLRVMVSVKCSSCSVVSMESSLRSVDRFNSA